MISVRKLRDDLDYWNHIGLGDDIVKCPGQRKEYQHHVETLKVRGMSDERIPKAVVKVLDLELRKFVLFRPTFWRILLIGVKRIVGL